MSKGSKIVCLIVTLLFIFVSLAGGAFAAVQTAAHDSNLTETGFHIDGSSGSPAYIIAGDCDAGMSCGAGSG